MLRAKTSRGVDTRQFYVCRFTPVMLKAALSGWSTENAAVPPRAAAALWYANFLRIDRPARFRIKSGNGDDVARTTRARMMTAPAPQHHDAKSEDALDRSDARWLRLQEIIRVQSLKVGEFVLSSGRTSTYLFQLRQTTMLPEGAALIGDIIVDYMKRHAIACIGGLEMGAVPIVAAVAAMSHLQNYPVDAFFVRESQKEHGARERADGHLRAGAEVLMIDDVATTGGSILKAIEGIEGHDCHVRRALAVVDREEGAAQNLAARVIQLAAIFKRSDFPEI
jgi:orotate phosphoribosyltransferase